MTQQKRRRLLLTVLFVAGPILGGLIGGDRGILLGLGVSLFAVIWFWVEVRRAL